MLWGAGGVFFEVTTKETYAGGSIDAGIRLAELSKRQAETAVKLTRQQVRFLTLGRSACSQYFEKMPSWFSVGRMIKRLEGSEK